MNKKGNLLDNPEAIIWIFGIMLSLFVISMVLNGFSTGIKSNPETNITQITGDFDTMNTKISTGWDYGVLFLAILLPLFSFIAAKNIPSDTIYMIITFFVLGFILLFSMIFSNIFGMMMDNAMFSTYMNGLRYIPFLFKNLLYYSIIYIFIVLLGMYTKTEERF